MTAIDLDRYAERIGLEGPRAPTLDLLERISFGHATRVPFENLDLHLGQGISIDPASVFEKLVARRRGGYCFEQNLLLLEALRGFGFAARPLAARVLYTRPADASPRTHMLVLVDVKSKTYLADVGFGVHNLLAPLPFEPDRPREIHGETFRLREIPWDGRALAAPPSFELEVVAGDQTTPLYRLSLEDQKPVDFEMANWFTSTHPDSFFVKSKIVSLPSPGVRTMLRDRELTVKRGGAEEKRTIEGDDAYRATLREIFGIDLGDRALRW
jgi:N-hydroxyarylamine O-acetyltransferase